MFFRHVLHHFCATSWLYHTHSGPRSTPQGPPSGEVANPGLIAKQILKEWKYNQNELKYFIVFLDYSIVQIFRLHILNGTIQKSRGCSESTQKLGKFDQNKKTTPREKLLKRSQNGFADRACSSATATCHSFAAAQLLIPAVQQITSTWIHFVGSPVQKTTHITSLVFCFTRMGFAWFWSNFSKAPKRFGASPWELLNSSSKWITCGHLPGAWIRSKGLMCSNGLFCVFGASNITKVRLNKKKKNSQVFHKFLGCFKQPATRWLFASRSPVGCNLLQAMLARIAVGFRALPRSQSLGVWQVRQDVKVKSTV